MKIKIVIFSLLSVLIASYASPDDNTAAGQNDMSFEKVKAAFEQAFKDMESEKKKEQQKLAEDLKNSLANAVAEWINTQKISRTEEMDKLLHERWEEVGRTAFPLPYDYYIRDCSYNVIKTDVFKTESLIAPYKGNAKITEYLYLETEHSSNASSLDPYLYTAITLINVNFEYQNDKFIPTDFGRGKTAIDRGWPQEIREKLKKTK